MNTDRQPGWQEIPKELIEQWKAEAFRLDRQMDDNPFRLHSPEYSYLEARKAAYLESITRTAAEDKERAQLKTTIESLKRQNLNLSDIIAFHNKTLNNG